MFSPMKSLRKQFSGSSYASSAGRSSDLNGRVLIQNGMYTIEGDSKRHLNEDRLVTKTLDESISLSRDELFALDPTEVVVSVLTDGHGGSGASEYVSQNLGTCVAMHASADCETLASFEKAIYQGFESCEEGLGEEERSGCCAMVCLANSTEVVVGHVGDVRAVFYDNGEISPLTEDHRASSLHEAVRVREKGAYIDGGRLNGILIPSRGFGDADIKKILPSDVLISTPDVKAITVSEEHVRFGKSPVFLVLTTDGVSDELTDKQVCDIVAKELKRGGTAESAAKKVAEDAHWRGDDDVTVQVLVWSVGPGSSEYSEMSEEEKRSSM